MIDPEVRSGLPFPEAEAAVATAGPIPRVGRCAMGQNAREFYVDRDSCTGCGNCIKSLPMAFRKARGRDVAEVFQVAIDLSQVPLLEEQMIECPGYAIRWRR